MAETEPGERQAAGTERGCGPGTERGTEHITGPGTERGTEHITGPGTERGTEHITGPGTEPSTERGCGPGTEPGTGPGTEPSTERGCGPGTEHITEPGTGPGRAEWPQRPPYSYAALITMAIRASPEQRLPLSGIYAYIAERFPFYRGPRRHWRNSVRHNLSLNPCFRRLPRRHGRAGDWELDPAFQDMFPEGNYLRRRCRRPSASPAPPSGIPPGPAALQAPPPSGMASLPAALWPLPPSGCPQGPWSALVLLPRYPELPAPGPPVPPGPPPAWALCPAGLGAARTRERGAGLSPALG